MTIDQHLSDGQHTLYSFIYYFLDSPMEEIASVVSPSQK